MAERLVIDRRRREESQRQAAGRHGTNLTRYSRWERGVISDDGVSVEESQIWAPALGNQLLPQERCMVLRRRAGLSQEELAKRMGRCRMWVRLMEQGTVDPAELVAYWENAQ